MTTRIVQYYRVLDAQHDLLQNFLSNSHQRFLLYAVLALQMQFATTAQIL